VSHVQLHQTGLLVQHVYVHHPLHTWRKWDRLLNPETAVRLFAICYIASRINSLHSIYSANSYQLLACANTETMQ
jgi:hypothetical protein